MFKRVGEMPRRTVAFFLDGEPAEGREGENVAAALLAGNHLAFRATAVSAAARGPYCMMGVCFDCLVEIDGVGNRQACMVTLEPGMKVRLQNGRRELRP